MSPVRLTVSPRSTPAETVTSVLVLVTPVIPSSRGPVFSKDPGWALGTFYQGELYRVRDSPGDQAKALEAYELGISLGGVPAILTLAAGPGPVGDCCPSKNSASPMASRVKPGSTSLLPAN